jgi:hypothetical protein
VETTRVREVERGAVERASDTAGLPVEAVTRVGYVVSGWDRVASVQAGCGVVMSRPLTPMPSKRLMG